MKKPVAALVAALLCLALLTACGTDVGLPNPDAPTINENAPPTTDAETTAIATTQETTTATASAATTSTAKPSTTNTTATSHFKDSAPPMKLLEYKMDENGIFYIARPTWMEYLYQEPGLQMAYGSVRVKFQYDQKDWLIQMWKGRYGIGIVMLACEICIATKPLMQTAEEYTLATPEEELVLKMDVYQKNFQTRKIQHLFTRGPEKTGWFNGLIPGDFHQANRKDEIIVVGSITFPDEEMLRAFEEPFAEAGFKKGKPGRDRPEEYSIDGTTLTFSWQFIDQG